MECIQHLTMTWPDTPTAPEVYRPATVTAPCPPSRESVRKLARRHHAQLVYAKRRTGSHQEMLRAQTEALRQSKRELTTEQWNAFMNAYTEDSSAVEREWMARQRARRVEQPLNPALTNAFGFAITILAVVAAISYVP